MPVSRRMFMNAAQAECHYVAAHTTIFIGGRRIGKSHGVIAPWLLRNVQYMPRATHGIVCNTYQQALTRTLPSTIMALEDMGYLRNVHFYVGVKPPPSAGFAKPVREPISYDRTISFYNGAVCPLISQDVPGSSNSLTLQSVVGDEAKFLDFDKLKDETFPANGGFPGQWRDCPHLNSMLFVTDMPSSKAGSWILGYKEHATEDIIEAIKICLTQVAHLSKLPPTSTNARQLRYYLESLAQLRRNAVYYREFSSIENVLILGESYIRQMKRDLPPIVFLTSIMSIRPGKLKGGFYPALSKSHCYTAFNNSYLDSIGLNPDRSLLDCRQDADLQANNPICIAFDYNANINWLVAGQVDGIHFRTLKSFFVKYERKLREVVDDFCRYYRPHRVKEVVYYYDTTAIASNYAVNNDDFATTICLQFEKNGWRVERKYIGNPPKHHEKYHIIDQGLKGQGGYLTPLFNEPNNEALILSMNNTDIKVGTTGWQKDKSAEKHAETEEDLLEFRTDGTDAWDTVYYGVNKYPYNGMVIFTGSVMM